jgi:hypothetical protein
VEQNYSFTGTKNCHEQKVDYKKQNHNIVTGFIARRNKYVEHNCSVRGTKISSPRTNKLEYNEEEKTI